MSRQPGFFGADERLSDLGDQLETFAAAVDFELFRPTLDTALAYADGQKGGRPPLDPVMMLKVLVIQAANNLSDGQAGAGVDCGGWGQDGLHRAGLAVGERLCGVV